MKRHTFSPLDRPRKTCKSGGRAGFSARGLNRRVLLVFVISETFASTADAGASPERRDRLLTRNYRAQPWRRRAAPLRRPL
jgi:hypothetical protein